MTEQAAHVLIAWASEAKVRRASDFDSYAHGIAEARYVMRKIARIGDDEARRHGLDPLQHQALLQAYGAGSALHTVGQLASRLDVAPALASRVVNSLARRELVIRRRTSGDRRVTMIEVSDEGVHLIKSIDHAVHIHLEYFQAQLTGDQQLAALANFSFYLGIADGDRSESFLTAASADG